MNVKLSNLQDEKRLLCKKLTQELKKSGYKIESLSPNFKSNPLLKFKKNGHTQFVYISQTFNNQGNYNSGSKIFLAMGKWHNEQIEPNKTYWIVIDFKTTKPVYVLVELDKIKFHYNKNKYLQFTIKRLNYNEFFNTRNRAELLTKIKNEKSKKE